MTPQEAARRRAALQEDLDHARADLAAQQDTVAQAEARGPLGPRASLLSEVLIRMGGLDEGAKDLGLVPELAKWMTALLGEPPEEGGIRTGTWMGRASEELRTVLLALVDRVMLTAGEEP